MTDTKARKAYFKILDKRREYLNSISNSTYPSVSYNTWYDL